MKQEYLYGIHTVLSILNQQPQQVLRLIILENRVDNRIQEILAEARRHRIPIENANRKTMDDLVKNANHQGIIACLLGVGAQREDDLDSILNRLDSPPFLLILDGVQDPHNLGACLRTADAVGINAVIAPKDRACSITPLVRKVASGAAESVPFIQVTNLARTMENLKKHNIWLYGMSDAAEQGLYEADLSSGVALVLGAEGKGLRRLTQERCDVLLSIPMYGSVSSLNVSVAAGVCLYEVRRQRLASSK